MKSIESVKLKVSYNQKESEREKKNRFLAREVASESIVLLENDGTLPICPAKVALYGAGAENTIKGGTGSGEVNERHQVNVREGLERAGFIITTDSWIEDFKNELSDAKQSYNGVLLQKMMSENVDDMINIMADPFQIPYGRLITKEDLEASDTDTCIFVIARQAGECSDRNLEGHDYNLSMIEMENLSIVSGYYKKVILIINAGSSIDMNFIQKIQGINAVVFLCEQGMEGGNALADILTGKVTPSGALSNSWAKNYSDIPYAMEYSYLNEDIWNEYYREGIYVGYRYYDSFQIESAYEFGYGLSYTDFSIDFVDVRIKNTIVSVDAKIRNIGSTYTGKKIVQLYTSYPEGRIQREYQSLVAFAKTKLLKSGEEELITLSFDLANMAAYDEKNSCFLLESGNYLLRLGESTRKNRICAIVTLDQNVVTEQCAPICPVEIQVEECFPDKWLNSAVSNDIPIVMAKVKDFYTLGHDYNQFNQKSSEQVEALMKRLTLEDMMKLVVGVGAYGVTPVFNVPGAAGFTTSDLYEKGICNIALCDGPAGIRLQRTSTISDEGEIKAVDAMMEFLNYLPEEVKQQMFGNPKKDTPIYQYATAFPVGTALAQTWNIDLIERIGTAVSEEMVEYGVTFWLAPGMNIQRNPLCGRNYEYYSEDPLLTGKIAAAISCGVQSQQGCYVTIKHFMGNNSETNRNKVNCHINERALREIYLKGFRIAVEEGKAKGVMTSYNKVNGVYTANSHDLCTKVLRREWGFEGVVMTDWFSTGKGLGSNGSALKSGNDLIMPGGAEYIQALEKDLEDGVVTEDDIAQCCKNVLKAIVNSRIQKEIFEELEEVI